MDEHQAPWRLSFELRDVAAQFVGDYYGASPKTQLIYADNVERVLLGFLDGQGVSNLLDVTPGHLRAYLQHEMERTYELKGGHVRRQSPTTINKRFETARTFFAWCVEQDYLPASPMAKVKRPKMPTRIRMGYSQEEVKRIVAAASKAPGWLGLRDRAIILVLLGTGARAGELCAMQESCVEWQIPRPRAGEKPQRTRYLTLHGKGSKDRRVPLGSTAFGALRDYMAARPPTHLSDIWVTQRGTVFEQGALNQMMVNLREYADVVGITPHRFRHTYAVAWYREHKNIMALKGLLGHSKVETTQRYLAGLGADYGLEEEYATPEGWLVA